MKKNINNILPYWSVQKCPDDILDNKLFKDFAESNKFWDIGNHELFYHFDIYQDTSILVESHQYLTIWVNNFSIILRLDECLDLKYQ